MTFYWTTKALIFTSFGMVYSSAKDNLKNKNKIKQLNNYISKQLFYRKKGELLINKLLICALCSNQFFSLVTSP